MPQAQPTSRNGVPRAPLSVEEGIDEAAAESFPASDPPAFTPTHAEPPPAIPAARPGLPSELVPSLRADVSRLTRELGDRHARLRDAADHIALALLDSGYAVTRYPFGAPREVENVEVELRGATRPEEAIVVGAHYDAGDGPCADDNASGVAILLALARILAQRRMSRSVRLVAFANEERPAARHPSMGGRIYAARLARDASLSVVGMLSLDMLGVFARSPSNFVAFVGDSASRALVRNAKRAFSGAFSGAAHVRARGLAVPGFLPFVGASDHASFWRWGVPAVLVTDTGPLRYRHYHRASDTPDRLDFTRMADVVTGLSAVVESLAGPIAGG